MRTTEFILYRFQFYKSQIEKSSFFISPSLRVFMMADLLAGDCAGSWSGRFYDQRSVIALYHPAPPRLPPLHPRGGAPLCQLFCSCAQNAPSTLANRGGGCCLGLFTVLKEEQSWGDHSALSASHSPKITEQ